MKFSACTKLAIIHCGSLIDRAPRALHPRQRVLPDDKSQDFDPYPWISKTRSKASARV
jgi:hypothetical protein